MIDEKVFNQLKSLVETWEGREGERVPADVVTVIFNTHNAIFDNKEYSKSCSGCREKVWRRLKNFYHENEENL